PRFLIAWGNAFAWIPSLPLYSLFGGVVPLANRETSPRGWGVEAPRITAGVRTTSASAYCESRSGRCPHSGSDAGGGGLLLPYGLGSGVSNTRISATPGGTPALSVALAKNRTPVVVTPSGNRKSGLGTPNGTKEVFGRSTHVLPSVSRIWRLERSMLFWK